MTNPPKINEAELAAFSKLFPHHARIANEYEADRHAAAHLSLTICQGRGEPDKASLHQLADFQRQVKKLVGDLRSLDELAEREQRELNSFELSAREAISKLMDNTELCIEKIEDGLQTRAKYTNNPISIYSEGKQRAVSPNTIYRADEKIATGPGQTRGLSIGRLMHLMVDPTARSSATEHELRSLNEASPGAGGLTVPVNLMFDYIDLLRAKMVCQRAGAGTVILSTQKTSIAQLVKDPVAAWRDELAKIAESEPSFEKIEFTARSLAVIVRVSQEVLADSVNINSAVEHALAAAMAAELDRAALYGSGTGSEPLGVVNHTGIKKITMTGAPGTLSSYGPIIFGLQALAQRNVQNVSAAIMNPATFYWLSQLTDSQKQPLRKPDVLKDLPFLDTTTVPMDIPAGTPAQNSTQIILGDFSEMLFGVRQDLRIELLTELYAETHEIGFKAHLRWDMALARPSSFCVIDQIVTPNDLDYVL